MKKIITYILAIAVFLGILTSDNIESHAASMGVTYRTYVQSYGWQGWVKNGAFSGTKGKAKRLESIQIKLTGDAIKGGISYRTYVQSYGWQAWKSNGTLAGTKGEGKRLEAIQIKLTGNMTKKFDVYYRVYAQGFGWLDWAKNGASAGTSGLSKRLEGIEIRLVTKGGKAPGKTEFPYAKKNTEDSIQDYTVPASHGWYKIGNKYYYYDRNTGKLKKGGEVCGIKLNTDGSAVLTTYAQEKLPVMVRAREVVESICNKNDSLEVKKMKCYDYVMSFPYLLKDFMVGDHINDWACLDAHYANNILNAYGNQSTPGGECTAQAAALAYLYAELNISDVYLYTSTYHGWVYAGGRYYDPNNASEESMEKWMNQETYEAEPLYTFKIN